jgi:SecD/SecF fusion protein
VRRYLVILLGLVAALGAVTALALVRDPILGIDLQGGSAIVLEAEAPKGGELTDEGMDLAVEVIRGRVDALGVSETDIRKQGDNQIAVELAGVDPERAADIVGRTARLELYKLQSDLVAPSISAAGVPTATTSLRDLLASQQEAAKSGTPNGWYLIAEDGTLVAGPADTREEVLAQVEGGEAPEGADFFAVPENRTVVTCGDSAVFCPGVNESPPTQTYYYLFKYQPQNAENPIPEMTGSDLELDGTRSDFDTQTGGPIVLMQFTDAGADKFHDITRALAQAGQFQYNAAGRTGDPDAFNQNFAIVLDDEMRSAPSIDFNDYPDGISGSNGAQITGLAGIQEAKDLALVLRSGALPYDFVQVERVDVSATLGEDSLREALIAGIGGLAAVAAFLLLFYRFLGLIAVIGLAIYGVFLYGAILVFDVTLTLAGFAGLILTIGVAADANIVIFERIKEEVRAGRSVRSGIATGYRKGFNTIVDANVVTMITAFVLFTVATSSVRGFALMLLIGTLISMLTAVLATRALLGLLAGFKWFNNPAFMGASAARIPPWQRIDFIGRRNLWFAFSAVVILIGIGSLGVKGLNLGIDFEGGSQVTFRTAQPRAVEEVRTDASTVVPQNAVIQGRGAAEGGLYSEFQIRTESLTSDEQNRLSAALERELGATAVNVKNVSASFSNQILRGALIAIVVSLILIVLYVSVRFEFRFAMPVLLALFHDILIAVGVYSLSGREVTASTVAALLTILGYSIYDTIIIFDRVRENLPIMRRSSFAAIANVSLWETIRRSLATTFITLLPVSSLLVFGGDTLKDFAFALLVGIGSGAYSTIFIATPFLAVLKEREHEFAKRKGAGLREKVEGGPEPEPEAAEAPPPPPEAPALAPAAPAGDGDAAASAAARREARRKRRARPHGRAR